MSDGSLIFETASHTAGPDHQGKGSYEVEKIRLEYFGAIRKAVEDGEGIDSLRVDISTEMVEDAISTVGAPPEGIDTAL